MPPAPAASSTPRPVALITGATSGIGAATIDALAADHDLVLVARRPEVLKAQVERLQRAGTTAWAVPADFATGDEATASRVIQTALAMAGRLDALVNNAGIFALAVTAELTQAHVEQVLRLNVQAPMLLTGHALPHLRDAARQRGVATVVNVSSIAATKPFASNGAYAAAKAGLDAWSRCLREEERSHRVRVSVIAPGATDTPVWPHDRVPDRARLCSPVSVAAAIRLAITTFSTSSIDYLAVSPPGGAL